MAASMIPCASAALETSPPHGDSLATGCGDGGDDSVRAGLAGSVVYDDRCAFCGECLGDGGSDAFGCAGNDCDFTCEFAHVFFWKSFRFRIGAVTAGDGQPATLQ